MSNLALYRKYRSRSFAEVVGQPHVVSTLLSAIKSGRISHAYLLTGPRGVGKTTVARLLAKSVNCTGKSEAKPCNECETCRIDLNNNLDLIEIDAASNRRIDEIRDLKEKIVLAPAICRYKVYIIDEVHMLTTEAFNALLKTLEEPPAHAIFILATTEVHKLPETIISRTQRFSFKPIQPADLAASLAAVAAEEKIQIEPEALEVLASASRGSLRDGLSMLDQVAGQGEKQVTSAAVRSILGLADSEIILGIAQATRDRNPAAALKLTDQAAAQGVVPAQLTRQLTDFFRVRLMLHLSDGEQDEAAQVSRQIETLLKAAKSPWPELALEIALVQLSQSVVGPGAADSAVQAEKPAIPSAAGDVGGGDPAPKAAGDAGTPETAGPAAKRGSTGLSDQDAWLKALLLIKSRNNSLYALLRTSCQASFEDDSVTLTCRFSFHRDRVAEPKNRQLIEAALDKVFGRPMKVTCQLESVAPAGPPARDNELISSALEILGGEIVE